MVEEEVEEEEAEDEDEVAGAEEEEEVGVEEVATIQLIFPLTKLKRLASHLRIPSPLL